MTEPEKEVAPAADGSSCPRCGAARGAGPECARCGVIFAKLAARASRHESPPPSLLNPEVVSSPTGGWTGDLEDARIELKLRIFAVPVALGFFWLLSHSGLRMLVRTFLSMWVHESGHAVAAWFCGYFSLPGPWRTSIGSARSAWVVLALLAALGFWAFRAFRAGRTGSGAAACALLLVQLLLTFGLGHARAMELVVFSGNGGSFVLGALLVATFYLPADHPLRREWLRWGFLVIGAAAIADTFTLWWAAHEDFAAIPFGIQEGVGLSDSSKLTQVYGWSAHELVTRYLTLAMVVLLALAILYGSGLVWARRSVRAAEAAAARAPTDSEATD